MSIFVYIARNHLGQFSCGHNWVDDFKDGRFYTQRGPVSGWVTRWVQSNPNEPVPEILRWEISPETASLGISVEETNKRVRKVKERTSKREEEHRKSMLRYLDEEEQRIAARRKESSR